MTENKICYPLVSWKPTRKEDVNRFWNEQSFDLGLEDYQGNCTWCWKKSDAKLWKLLDENPNALNFPAACEQMYGLSGHNKDGNVRKFFRGNRSAIDVINRVPSKSSDKSPCEDSCEAQPT